MQNQSSKLGHSSSPLVDKNIQNSQWDPSKQQTDPKAALNEKHTDHPFQK